MRYFTDSHAWVEPSGDEAVVGITSRAQQELGEIVFISFPPVGHEVSEGDEIAVLESTKAAVDLYAPVAGVVIEHNPRLKDNVGLLNVAPETEGWIYKLRLTRPEELGRLLSQHQYESLHP